MKRSILFSFIVLTAISTCFFSSAVFAGEGTNSGSWGDTHPWDVDVIVNDTSDGVTSSYTQSSESFQYNPFVWISFSLTYRMPVWLFNENFILQNEKQNEVIIKSEINARGKYRSKN